MQPLVESNMERVEHTTRRAACGLNNRRAAKNACRDRNRADWPESMTDAFRGEAFRLAGTSVTES